MPLPFILGAAAIAAGGYGVKKGLDAKENMDKAESLNEKAQKLVESAKYNINGARSSTDKCIKNLGKTKISIMAITMKDFVDSFSKIKNVNLNDSVGLDELRDFTPNSEEFIDMKNASFEASELAAGGVGGIAAGALTAAGAYGAVGAFATASTGTAIAGLTGAAATNATLAWLGGGALSAGGFGMAGGMAVLGGIVAGPALAIGGAFMASKAEEALNDARSNYDKARKFYSEADNIYSVLNAIKSRGDQINDLLNKLNKKFDDSIKQVNMVIELMGTDWSDYNKTAKEKVGKAAQLAKTIKIVLDTSLLKEDGKLNEDSKEQIKVGQAVLEKFA